MLYFLHSEQRLYHSFWGGRVLTEACLELSRKVIKQLLEGEDNRYNVSTNIHRLIFGVVGYQHDFWVRTLQMLSFFNCNK